MHAVIHKKKQFKQELKDGMDTLKKVNEANLEAEKAINLKSRAKSAKEQRK